MYDQYGEGGQFIGFYDDDGEKIDTISIQGKITESFTMGYSYEFSIYVTPSFGYNAGELIITGDINHGGETASGNNGRGTGFIGWFTAKQGSTVDISVSPATPMS